MKRITMQLEPNKTVEIAGFRVSGSNTVYIGFLRFVELDITVSYDFDFSGYTDWKKANPTLTWRDYAKNVLLPLYNSYALAKNIKDILDEEAVE